jgi:3-hydroxybutyrate dehydrogenase
MSVQRLLDGRVAVVTGSTSGIGLGIAESLAEAGARVVLNGFGTAAVIEHERKRLESTQATEVRYLGADLTRSNEVRGLIDYATREFGGVDILVNNAGMQHVAMVQDFPPERWYVILELNLSAVFHRTRAVLPGLLARGWGRIINVASVHGLVASTGKSAYVAAKHGVVGLTKVAALETARTGVTSNAICPGWVLTPLVEQQIAERAAASGRSIDDERRALLAEKQPSETFVTTRQLGALCVFLCSPAADEIRGQAITVDGGWTAQ